MSRRERLGWSLYCLVGILAIVWLLPLVDDAYQRGAHETFKAFATIMAFVGAATLWVGTWVVSPGKSRK